jgi:SNF2 family DNA or RNA helicase
MKATGGFYEIHDPGMGKTLDAITLARLLKVKRILVACPVAALGVWERELRKWWPGFAAEATVWTVTWDGLVSKQKEICAWEPELFIMDEAHYAKTASAARTKAATQVRQWSVYCLALSGTPIHNDLDWFAQMRMIARSEPLFKQTFTQFRDSLVVMEGPGGRSWPKKKNGQFVYKPGAKEQLLEVIGSYVHHATADQMHVPEPVVTEIPVDLETDECVAYDNMENYLRAQLPSGEDTEAEIVLTKLLRLTQIAAGHATSVSGNPERIGYSKRVACMDLLEERAHKKVIIACRFKEDIQGLRDALNAQGRPLAIIWGETSAAYRTQYENWFQSDMHDNGVLLVQYQAGGVALTLTAAHTLIPYTLDPSVIRWRQMLGRVWRLGQDKTVEVLPLLANDTQDWVMWEALQAGVNNAEMAYKLMGYLHR